MSDGVAYADIIILALVAGFILLRLRSVLGQKNEGDELDVYRKQDTRFLGDVDSDPVVQLSETALKPRSKSDEAAENSLISTENALDAIQKIKKRDPQFNVSTFLSGAQMAFEMVFDAFAKGDKQTLNYLLSDDLQNEFAQEIEARKNASKQSDTTLVSVKAQRIIEAELDRNMARLTVDFLSEQVTIVRDITGAVIEGSVSSPVEVEDRWTFERDITSKNPNWKIIET